METVEVVIRIPKETYARLSFGVTYTQDIQTMCYALAEGTVLPKGHEELVELGKVVDMVTEYVPDDDGSVGNTNLKDLLYEVENMERVIEADKEAEDETK